jgi:hypothetical protein
MARIRTIKPSFFKNEDLAELPMQARLLFIGLWALADKEGRLEDRPKRIKVELFPYDSVDIDGSLSRLQSAGFIKRYGVGEMKVIQILSFSKHQRITGSEATTESEFPAFEEVFSCEETPRKHFGNTEDDRKGKEGKGDKERKEGKEKVRDFVTLTPSEIEKLILEFGEEAYEWMINKLNSFKGSKGKTYKSDYLAIHSWVVKAYGEEKEKRSAKKVSSEAPGRVESLISNHEKYALNLQKNG